MPNALASSTSPYLRQHADNPVAWQPWGDAAFAEAKRRDVPVLISIGYSTCHWCHVMAHESFEDPTSAALLNERFVCIKVDREEHPEVDHIYMDAVQALTGHGGWPLNAFIDHQGRPFYACTYLPRAQWNQLGEHLANLWRHDRERILGAATEITAHLQDVVTPAGDLPHDLETKLAQQLRRAWDEEHPGLAWNQQKAPKFPPNQFVNLATGHPLPALREMGEAILEAMQDSGLHDRVGGGFHRYSVDAQWRLPHFEKMLYDNAQLIPAYIRHGRSDFRQTAINAGDYLLRDLRIGAAFAAAEDADDPDGEGSFYAWSPQQLVAALGAADGEMLAHAWNVSPGQRHVTSHGPEPVSSHIPHPRGAGPVTERAAWEIFLPRLRAVRAARPRPGRDDKLLTDHNGLALEALAWLGRLSRETRFCDAARELAEFVASRHTPQGLLRTSERPAYITDYGAAVCGLCAGFDLLGDPRLILQAAAIAEEAVIRLRGDNGGFFSTPLGRTDLIRRTQEHTDNAWPGGEAHLALGYARLWNVTGEPRWFDLAEGILRAAAQTAERAPASSITLIQAWRLLRDGPRTLVVCGDDPELLAAARACRDPRVAVIPVATCSEQNWSCLTERRSITRPQVLFCLGTRCLAPAYTPAEVLERLTEAAS